MISMLFFQVTYIQFYNTAVMENHFKIADEYIQLGQIYVGNEDYEMAEEYYFMALNIQVENLGEHHPDIAGIYNNLGLIAGKLGSYSASLTFLTFTSI